MFAKRLATIGALMMFGLGASCSTAAVDPRKVPDPATDLTVPADAGPQTVVLAGGCFWCTETVFENWPGVTDVVSGYAGGTEATANYQAVSAGQTDHAEVIKITYDPAKVSYGQLLKVFFSIAHDPTQLNRQGPDTGRQYRSAVFYADDEQKQVAEAYIKQLNETGLWDKPIVTTLEPLDAFYVAEAYHQDYVQNNPNQPYVVQYALPKREKAIKNAESAEKPQADSAE